MVEARAKAIRDKYSGTESGMCALGEWRLRDEMHKAIWKLRQGAREAVCDLPFLINGTGQSVRFTMRRNDLLKVNECNG